MQVHVLVKPAVTTNYIAERETNRTREEHTRRPLFTSEHDNLTPKEANQYLAGTNAHPDRRDIAHLVVTLDHAARFESLAQTNKERRAAMTAAVRETMQEFERLTGTKDVRFIAGIHLNTENPHAHILLNKNVTDALTGERRRLEHLPQQLTTHRARVGLDTSESHAVRASTNITEQDNNSQANTHTPISASPETIFKREQTLEMREGKLAAAFRNSLAQRSTPPAAIAHQIEADGKLYRRFITDQPTAESRIVGEYVQAESRFTGRETPAEAAHLQTLRERVAQLDTEAREKGQAAPRAYLTPEDVTRGIIENRFTPLDKTGAQIERYEAPHPSQERAEPTDALPQHGGQIVGFITQDTRRIVTREVVTIDAPVAERERQETRAQESERTTENRTTADARQPTKWIHVTAAEPCPCCGRTSNCAISEDGRRAYCRYEPSPLQGRDGGYTHHLDKRPDFVPREITARPEVSNNIASVEHRNEVYREMLKHLYLNDTDYNALRERGLTDERITAKGYVSTPNRAEANHIAETLDTQGVDLRGVPGFWRARHHQSTVS